SSVLDAWGAKYAAITSIHEQFYVEAAAGNLPAVCVVAPGFIDNDHPHSNLLAGEALLAAIYRALTAAPTWKSTVWVITFDEWGGFFDHVPPPRAAAANPADPDV